MDPTLSSFTKSVVLYDWWLVKDESDGKKKRLSISGFTSKGKQAARLFRSSPIIKRHDSYTLETSDGVTVMIQGLINRSCTHQQGFPSEACNHFLTGFPYNWALLASRYLMMECQEENASSKFTFNTINTSNNVPMNLDVVPMNKMIDTIMYSNDNLPHDASKINIFTDLLKNFSASSVKNCFLETSSRVDVMDPPDHTHCMSEIAKEDGTHKNAHGFQNNVIGFVQEKLPGNSSSELEKVSDQRVNKVKDASVYSTGMKPESEALKECYLAQKMVTPDVDVLNVSDVDGITALNLLDNNVETMNVLINCELNTPRLIDKDTQRRGSSLTRKGEISSQDGLSLDELCRENIDKERRIQQPKKMWNTFLKDSSVPTNGDKLSGSKVKKKDNMQPRGRDCGLSFITNVEEATEGVDCEEEDIFEKELDGAPTTNQMHSKLEEKRKIKFKENGSDGHVEETVEHVKKTSFKDDTKTNSAGYVGSKICKLQESLINVATERRKRNQIKRCQIIETQERRSSSRLKNLKESKAKNPDFYTPLKNENHTSLDDVVKEVLPQHKDHGDLDHDGQEDNGYHKSRKKKNGVQHNYGCDLFSPSLSLGPDVMRKLDFCDVCVSESDSGKQNAFPDLVEEDNVKSKEKAINNKGRKKVEYLQRTTPILTRKKSEELLFVSTESFQRSRSGRILIPRLDNWRNQQIVYEPDGQISGVKVGLNLQNLSTGSRSHPYTKKRNISGA